MTSEDCGFRHRLRVRWAEADMQGVVFNGHYMTYFDVAVTEYWRGVARGDPQALREIFDRLYVVRTTIEFHSPARFDDEIDVPRISSILSLSRRVFSSPGKRTPTPCVRPPDALAGVTQATLPATG